MKTVLTFLGLTLVFLGLVGPAVGQDEPSSEPTSLPTEPTSQPTEEASSLPSGELPTPEALVFDGSPLTATGMAGGSVDASQFGEGCVGMVGLVANHTLTSDFHLPDLAIDGGEFDLTIVIAGPEGTYCQDDRSSRNTNPFVNIWSAFDEYSSQELQIFIGTKDGGMHPYTLTIEDGAG